MAAPRPKREDARAQIRKMERAVLERKIAELQAQRAAVPEHELEEWLTDRTALELVLLGGYVEE